MTVKELVIELQNLIEQGHGELDVIVAIPCERDKSTNLALDHFIPISDEYCGSEAYKKGSSYAQQHCIEIWANDP